MAVLSEEPVCPVCQAVGKVEPATEVDHITPRRLAPDLMFSRSNLWGLCRDCHREKTRLEHRGVDLETRDRWTIGILLRQGRIRPRDLGGMGRQNPTT
jgi:5-methylcytosine-specific restriction endonuclease McrA